MGLLAGNNHVRYKTAEHYELGLGFGSESNIQESQQHGNYRNIL
jgi:hypothetical protein